MEMEHLIVKSKDSIMDFDMYVYCIIIASWAAIKKDRCKHPHFTRSALIKIFLGFSRYL